MHCETLLVLMVLSCSVLGILVACPLIPSKVFRTLYLPFDKMQCELAFQTHIHTYDAKVFPKYYMHARPYHFVVIIIIYDDSIANALVMMALHVCRLGMWSHPYVSTKVNDNIMKSSTILG